jgi:hypothetical protein
MHKHTGQPIARWAHNPGCQAAQPRKARLITARRPAVLARAAVGRLIIKGAREWMFGAAAVGWRS